MSTMCFTCVKSRQISNISCILVGNNFFYQCSWTIACRRCSNFVCILILTPGFNGLGIYVENCNKMKREKFEFRDLDASYTRDFTVCVNVKVLPVIRMLAVTTYAPVLLKILIWYTIKRLNWSLCFQKCICISKYSGSGTTTRMEIKPLRLSIFLSTGSDNITLQHILWCVWLVSNNYSFHNEIVLNQGNHSNFSPFNTESLYCLCY